MQELSPGRGLSRPRSLFYMKMFIAFRFPGVHVTGPTKQLSRHVRSLLGLSSNDTDQGNEVDLVESSQTTVRDYHCRQDVS